MPNNHLISDTITDLKSQEVLNLRLSIHKPYGYGKSMWNFYMDMDRMNIWIMYGHTEKKNWPQATTPPSRLRPYDIPAVSQAHDKLGHPGPAGGHRYHNTYLLGCGYRDAHC